MGAFFLLRRDGPSFEARRDALLAEFQRQGFRDPRCFEAGSCVVHAYRKLSLDDENAHVVGADQFCLSVGTFFYRGLFGEAALAAFLRAFDPSAIPWDDVCGQFCLIVAKAGAVHVLTDRVGLYKVYRSSDASIVTSSFLAMVAVTDRRTIDPQSLYEYVFQGATFGTKTIFAEIALSDPDRMLTIDRAGSAETDLAPMARGFAEASFEELLKINLENLRRYFAAVTAPFGDRVATALTSGYDSRLVLALLRERGLRPYVYVYGAPEDVDVQMARGIAEGEGFAIDHTDKGEGPRLEREEFAATVESNYRLFDGYPVDGIFDNGSDERTRRERCRSGALVFNGIGGELFRRPDLSNLPYPVRDVVWRFYCQIDPLAVTAAFREEEYCRALEREIRRVLGSDAEPLPRSDIALLPSAFYHRYWAGRNASVNNRLGFALQPFCDWPVVREAIRIPIAQRWYGGLQTVLIRAVDPRLAAYPSRHGHDFAHPTPLAPVVREWRSTVRAPVYYRYSHARSIGGLPYWLERPYLEAVLDPSFPYLSRFFHVVRLRDRVHYKRICNLEFLFQRCSAVSS